MRKSIAKTLVLLLVTVLVAQVLSVLPAVSTLNPPNVTWFTFGTAVREDLRALVQTSDAGFALAGFQQNDTAGWMLGNLWLVRISSNYEVLWNNSYGTVADWEHFGDMVETSDGGFALAGSTRDYGFFGLHDQFWVFRVDSMGNVLWNQIYGGLGNDEPKSIIQTSDGGFAVAGSSNSFEGGPGVDISNAMYLAKLDPNGAMQWNHTYTLGGEKISDSCSSVIETSDGGFALAGYSQNFTSYPPRAPAMFWLVKTNANGGMEWNQTYFSESFSSTAWSIKQTSDGGFALVGQTGLDSAGLHDFGLIKTDEYGNVEWKRSYGGSKNDLGRAFIGTTDGGFALAGTTESFGAGGRDIWLVKTDSYGNTEWNEPYGGSGDDLGVGLVENFDGSYTLAGSTSSFGAGSSDFCLVKIEIGEIALAINANPPTGGSVTVSPSQETYNCGDAVQLTATPAAGWTFAGWNGTIAEITNPATLRVGPNPQVTATFVQYVPPPVGVTHGGGLFDRASHIVETGDGGFAYAGWTNSFGAGGYDFWLVRTDASGNVLWNQTYGGLGNELAVNLVLTGDGGFALSGPAWTSGPGGDDYNLWLVRTDASGTAMWNRTYGGPSYEFADGLVLTGDGGFALAGYTSSFGAGSGDMWLVRTDASGNVLWNRTYGGSGSDWAYGLVLTGDGGFALAGSTNSFGAGGNDMWLVRTDASGIAMWNHTYGGSGSDAAYGLVLTGDGGFALAGPTGSFGAGSNDIWLVRTDSAGTMSWSKTFGGSLNDVAYGLVLTGDGGFALAGYTSSFGAGSNDVWLVRTDASGVAMWNRTYGGSGSDSAYSLVLTSGGRFALAGTTYSYGYGSSGDAWLVFEPPAYSVTVSLNPPVGGSVLKDPDLATYELGTSVELTAVPAAGWAFAGWSGDLSGTSNPAVLTIDADPQVTATFVEYVPPPMGVTYGGGLDDIALDIISTSDGGYAIAGYTDSFGAGGYDFWLVKTDAAGNMLWNRTYGGTGTDYALDLVQTDDGGYALTGRTDSFGAGNRDMWLVRTDASGNMLWNKTYGGSGHDWGYGLVLCGDGGFAIAGSTESFGAGNSDFWLVRTDASGNMLWNKTYGEQWWEYNGGLVLTGDGGYALAGMTNSFGAGGYDFWLVKTDAVGNMLWNRTYGGTGYEFALDLVDAGDGGFALLGWTSVTFSAPDDFWLVRTDSAGNMLWNGTYGTPAEDFPVGLIQTGDGGYALVGYTESFGAGSSDMWLVRTDSTGTALWNQTYGGSGWDVASESVQIDDDSFALAGRTESFGYGRSGNPDAWFVIAQAPTYSLTVTVNPPAGGSVSRDPDLASYELGSVVQLTAVPADGWAFAGWSGDLEGTANPATLVIDEDPSVTATFTQIEYTLTVSVAGSGSVNKIPDQATYHHGDSVQLSAEPADGWTFTGWSGDLTGITNPATFAIDADPQVTATFVRNEEIGINVACIVEGGIPESPWHVSVTDVDTGIVVADFVLPAGGGTISLPQLGVSGGNYLVIETMKYYYDTSVDVNGTLFIDSQAFVILNAGDVVNVTFTNTANLGFIGPLDGSPPPNLSFPFAVNKPVPVQSAWSIDKNIPLDGKLDIVVNKTMAILVNVTDPALTQDTPVTVNVVFDSVTYPGVRLAGSAQSRLIAVYPILPNKLGEFTITGTYQVGAASPVDLAPTTVVVRDTVVLKVFFAYFVPPHPGDYDVVTPEDFEAVAANITSFIGATYPIKRMIVNATYTPLAGNVTLPGQGGANKDVKYLASVARRPASGLGTDAIGVAIVPQNYFDYHGFDQSIYDVSGWMITPSTKACVVSENYYAAAAHEVAHVWYSVFRPKEYYDVPGLRGTIVSGVWPDRGEWRTGWDIMDYTGDTDGNWIGYNYTHRMLLNKTTYTIADPEILLASGSIYKNGTVELDPWYRVLQGTPDPIIPGNYSLRFIDEDGNELSVTSFDASFHMEYIIAVRPGQDVDPSFTGVLETDFASFAFSVVLPEGTATVQVVNMTDPSDPDGEVLATVNTEGIEILGSVESEAYFTDSNFEPIDSFDVLFKKTSSHSTTLTLTATDPATYYYTLDIANNGPALPSLTVAIQIPADFVLEGAQPVQVDFSPANYTFADGVLTVTVPEVGSGQTFTLRVHLDYALKGTKPYPADSPTTFLREYTFETAVNGLLSQTSITAVGKKATAIGGFVKDTFDEPKSGLQVRVYKGTTLKWSTTVDGDGFYFVEVQAGGPYSIILFNSNNIPVWIKTGISVATDAYVPVDFTVLPIDCAIQGFVKENYNTPVAGVTVQLLGSSGNIIATTTTNLGGYYVFRFYLPGTYTVKIVVPPGYTAPQDSQSVRVRLTETATVNFNVERN